MRHAPVEPEGVEPVEPLRRRLSDELTALIVEARTADRVPPDAVLLAEAVARTGGRSAEPT